MAEIIVTRHAFQRARERMGIPARAVRRAVQRAWQDGLTPTRKWANRPSGSYRVHGEFVFVFEKRGRDDTACVTILSINENADDRDDRNQDRKINGFNNYHLEGAA